METLASPWFVPLMAVLCYLGAVLYGGVVSVSGRYADAAGWPLLIYYVTFFPTPVGSGLWIVQSFVVFSVGVAVGPDIVYRFVKRKGEYTRGDGAPPVSFAVRVLIAFPALVAMVWVIWLGFTRVFPARHDLALLNEILAPVWGGLLALVGAYFGVAYWLGAQTFRDFDRMPLLRTSMRFHRMNGIGALAAPCIGAIFFLAGPYSTAGQSALMVLLVIGLAPGLNELAWSYDAVLTRILTAHVVITIAACIVYFVPGWIEWLGGGVLYRWAVTLVILAVVAMAVPQRVEARTLEWFFPQAAASRARLAGLMSEPFDQAGRPEVATALLHRVVDTLEAEGGLVVLPAAGADGPILEVVGNIDLEALGSIDEIVAWVAETAPGGEPVWYESLPVAQRVRMLFGGAVLLCPLGSGRNGALLLGPRRGWLYDRHTIGALQMVGQQARFAFENLALLRSRAHGEKLEALGEAAARIAHEIRNPLAGARSLVQLAGESAEARDAAEPALEELDRIGRLVDDLLAFARREDVLHKTEFDLVDACSDALGQVALLCETGGVEVETDLETVVLSADRDRVVQVLANLARNAVEALTGAEGRRLYVGCGCADGEAYVEVADDGPGIPAESRQAIFEPFHTSKREGTGLGLAIGQRIARAHDGELALVAMGEPGTRFRLTLPAL